MIRAHKIRLNSTASATQLLCHEPLAPAATREKRRALAEWNRQYTAGEKPTALGSQEAVQCHQTGALPLDLGGDEKRLRSALSGPGQSVHHVL